MYQTQQSAKNEGGEIGKNTTIVGHIRGRWSGSGKENATTNQIRGERQKRTNAVGGGGGGQDKQHNNQQSTEADYVVIFCCVACVC
eukprot:scaffold13509_cov35-Cyclotella_meneghiniana.AAC.1